MKKGVQKYLWASIVLLQILQTSSRDISTDSQDESVLEILSEDDYNGGDVFPKSTEEPSISSKKSIISPKVSPPSTKDDLSCPPPFFRVMFECFYIHVHHHLIWWEARDFCRDMGGDLAEPSSQAALIAAIGDKYRDGPIRYWVGGSDLKQEGNFTWLSGKPVTGWRLGQPNDYKDENCLELWSSRYPSYGDKNCYHKCAFICQYYDP